MDNLGASIGAAVQNRAHASYRVRVTILYRSHDLKLNRPYVIRLADLLPISSLPMDTSLCRESKTSQVWQASNQPGQTTNQLGEIVESRALHREI